MYQNVYGHGGGQNGQFQPAFTQAGLPYTTGYQQGAPYGQQAQALGALYGQMPVPGQVPTYTQYTQPYFINQAQGYPQAPGPPSVRYGGHQPLPLQPPPPQPMQQRGPGGGGEDRRHRRFTEAPGGHGGENKRQAISGGPQNGPARYSRDEDVGRRRDGGAAPEQQSRGGRQGGDRDERRGDVGVSQGGQQYQQQQQQQMQPSSQQQQQHQHMQQRQQYQGGNGGPPDVGQRQPQQQQRAGNQPGSGFPGGQDNDRSGPAGPSGAGPERGAAPPAGAEAAARGVADSGGGGGAGLRPRQRRIYTVLARNIGEMVEHLSPSSKEVTEKDQVLQLVRQATQVAFPEFQGVLRAEPFGSYMCGLGSKSSDIDVVLVGLAEPSPSLGFYSQGERPRIARLLDRLTPHLRSRLRVSKLIAVRHARVPILKITTAGGVSVDISIAGMGGPHAAAFIRQQVSSFPALRPLVLVLKSYMRELELGEVAKGGLSSYGLTYMVMAHLMEESRRGSDTTDLGALLHSMMRRYGRSFDMGSMAVSVRHGGLVPRAQLQCGNASHQDRIVTIDPLTGRNITEGTFRSAEVLDAFSRADAYLTAWAARRDEDVSLDADILAPLVSAVPDEDEEQYVQEYAPPANGAPLGKRGRSQELR